MANIFIIDLNGKDRPGVTAQLTETLASFGAQVLDINQAVVQDHLMLGIMVRVPDAQRSGTGPVVDALIAKAQELELEVNHRAIEDEHYGAWEANQGKPRYILTLIARVMTAERLAAVTQVVQEQGLNIDVITRLSGRPQLADLGNNSHEPENTLACVDFSLRGEATDMDAMKQRFVELASEHGMDIAFQHDNVYRRNRRLVAFDMDSTLIQHEVIDELAVEAGPEIAAKVAAITESAMRGELNFQESLRQRVAALAGLEEEVLKNVGQRLRLTEGAERLVKNLKRFGYKTAILSGGFKYFGRMLQERLGIDYVCANELEIVDGKLTGRVIEPIVDGRRKAEQLEAIALSEKISLDQVIAVGDGANDLPMLRIAGLGIAFHAKPIVQQSAEHRISQMGLDGILYLIGVGDRDLVEPEVEREATMVAV